MERAGLLLRNSSLMANYVLIPRAEKYIVWPPWCHDGEGISCDILTWDHNALSYRNGRLIILPTPSQFSHIYQNNVKFLDLMFEDTKYHGYTLNICPLKLNLNQE